MKRWHALSPNWAIITLLTIIVICNFLAYFYNVLPLSNAIALLLIPALLTLYFYRQRFMANVFFSIFLLYFLGIIFQVFDNFALSTKLSESFLLGTYLMMIFVLLGSLKHIKFEGVVSGYLIIVLLVNAYLMYAMFSNVQDNFMDSVILTLAVCKGIALLIMGFVAFAVYLSQETSQSILFLSIVCCFVFADVLSFTTTVYVQFWLFESFHNILQGLGLFMLCIYVFNHQQLSKDEFLKERRKSLNNSNHLTIQS